MFLNFQKLNYFQLQGPEFRISIIKRGPAAKVYFSKVPQCTILRVINDLADTGNKPIVDDCWKANTDMSRRDGRERTSFGVKMYAF
jgi:hypothetical protein